MYRFTFLSLISLSTTVATRIAFECNTGRQKPTIVGWVVLVLSFMCLANFFVTLLFQAFTFTVADLVEYQALPSEIQRRDLKMGFPYVTELGQEWEGYRMGA